MIDFGKLKSSVAESALLPWIEEIQPVVEAKFDHRKHGDLRKWKLIIRELPEPEISKIVFDDRFISISSAAALDREEREMASSMLKELMPWRKGPYNILGIEIDTEWRSDLKWDRLKDAISPLSGKTVLDVGCGNGYHMWRMAGAGAKTVIGIDPYMLSNVQFHVLNKYINSESTFLLPLGIEEMPADLPAFDTVFSMGVLYHRRSPFDHLYELKSLLSPGGELVLETLVIDGKEGETLVPMGRYAKMRNIWFLPSVPTLKKWLERSGFKEIKVIDVTRTTSEEQRVTDWMDFESLENFLNPANPHITIEGYPAPVRAIFTARK
ncbi:MAG: tRNA U34 carboxymethyltransferase [Melioribacteraceae bacterium]|nr:MAG: tRNA U34 carboxymethyltransferase [Melioribacteraceae bacterium]